MRTPLLGALGLACGAAIGAAAALRRAGAAGARAAREVVAARPRATVRGIRGAITVPADEAGAILSATAELLLAIVARNGLDSRDVAAALFTVTPDLSSEFPAAAARAIGWTQVPLLNFTEIGVPGRLARVIRCLVLVNSGCGQDEVDHVYLGEATTLRPDLASRSAQ